MDTLALLFEPGDVFEMRALDVRRKATWTSPVELGFFNDFEAAASVAREWDGLRAKGVYVTLNPVNPDLLARAANRVITPKRGQALGTKDPDIVERRWFPIDIDPVRVAGISSSQDERRAAAAVTHSVRAYLAALGWPEPVTADSGNGFHLLYRIKMKAEDKGTVSRMLSALALRFDTDKVKVDTQVANPSRIWKLYGTMARKGDSTPDRPWRRARVMKRGDGSGVVWKLKKREVKALLATVPRPSPGKVSTQQIRNRQALDLWISRHELEVDGPSPWEKGRKWVGCCPWDVAHTDRSFAIVQFGNGAIAARCQHVSCDGKGWRELTEELGPLFPKKSKSENQSPTEKTSSTLQRAWTDMGNADRFVRLFGGQVRYVGDMGRWYVWNGTRWEADLLGRIKDMAKIVARSVRDEALALDEEADRNLGLKWAVTSQGVHRVSAMTALAQPDVSTLLSQFDADPWLLNVQNGTIDLKTGELRPHSREDYITQVAPVKYDPEAKCPRWEKFCLEVMDGNQELVDYLQRFMGYASTGLTREQVLAFFLGTGANGKSTFLVALQKILGSYTKQAAPELLVTRRSNGASHPTGIADLRGSRLVVSAEIERGAYLSEGLVKHLTGGDVQKARFMRQDFFEFDATHTIVIAANHKPIVRGNDDGVWRRIHLVPFPVSFPPDKQDVGLGRKLLQEAPGILNWLVTGARQYREKGLNPPDIVQEATREYRSGMDLLHDFIEDCCIKGDRRTVMGKKIYERYIDWCEEQGEQPVKRRMFHMMLDERGIGRKRVSAGIRREGLALKYEIA